MRYDKTPAWGATCGMKAPAVGTPGSLSRATQSGTPIRDVAIVALERAVREVYGCGTVLLEVVPVIARVAGQASLFAVTIFRLVGHPTAARCFAWSSSVEKSARTDYMLVLEAGQTVTAADAVQYAMEQKAQAACSGQGHALASA